MVLDREECCLACYLIYIYIDSLIDKISKLECGCLLGLTRSNIVAYADDIVLIAPSATSLQYLMNIAILEIDKLDLNFNYEKTKTMVFDSNSPSSKASILKSHFLDDHPVECVSSFKYLGYILASNLRGDVGIF